MSGKLKVTGMENLIEELRTMTPKVQRQVLRPAARAGTKAPRQYLKSHAPRRSGALRKAEASKVSTNREEGTVTGTVGPSRKYSVVTKTKSGRFVSGAKQVAKHAKDANSVRGVRPSRYAHLAGPGRTADYMEEAQKATQQQTLNDFTARARQEMMKVAAKMASKGKK